MRSTRLQSRSGDRRDDLKPCGSSSGGDGQDAPDQQAFSEPITVVAFVGKWRLGRGDRDLHQHPDRGVFGGLLAGQDEPERQPLIFTEGVDFARKAAA